MSDSADAEGLTTKEFGGAFKRFLDQAVSSAPQEEAFFTGLLRRHLGTDPLRLPVVSEQFEAHDHGNVQVALDAYLAQPARSAEIVGVKAFHKHMMGTTLSDLLTPPGPMGGGPTQGPVEYLNLSLEGDRKLNCIQFGLVLVTEERESYAVLVRGPHDLRMEPLRVEVMAPSREAANRLLDELRRSISERNIYRGHVLSLSANRFGALEVHYHPLPEVDHDSIILPPGVLERVERHTLGFARHRHRLARAGRHLKRGILLHGAPGTGKTLTAMYLASAMTERTVLLLTGRTFGLIKQSCALARMLAPSMVVLEDVDLVAEERTGEGACTPLLFELLNEMDGLAEDVDVIFLLTTNRPDLLEPALAARPGRVDQAIEIPLPDEDSRRRLLQLYGEGLDLRIEDASAIVKRTEGTSGAFIRELLRKAALYAAEEGNGMVVYDRHISDSLHDLLVHGGELTKRLLGVQVPPRGR
ncbi:MAG: AAA family ATPase [Actinomycetota bacterium]